MSEHPLAKTPLRAFLEWYRQAPDDIAVECAEEWNGEPSHLTVRQVYARACQLASVMTQKAYGQPGDVVGIMLELESELYVAFIACWLAGRTPTILSTTWASEVFMKIAERLRIHVIVSTRLQLPDLDGVVNIKLHNMPESEQPFPPLPSIPEPHYAMINASSGTTGTPKSIPVRTAMYAQFCPEITKAIPRRLRTAFVTTPIFSGITAGIYLSTYTRGVCVYAGVSRDKARGYVASEIADNVLKLVTQWAVDAVGITASLFAAFDSMLDINQAFPGPTWINFGGEITSPDIVRAAQRRFPNATITIHFSSTESVQAGFGVEFAPRTDLSDLREIVLRPNRNIDRFFLLDDDGAPLELTEGAIGRLAVATEACADSYIFAGSPRDDEETFRNNVSTQDTFRWTEEGERLICFGDRAQYRAQSHGVVILGREGRRIKQNGVFVDLSIVDVVIGRNLQILKDVCVLAVGSILACLYVVEGDVRVTADEINNALARELDSIHIGVIKRLVSMPVAKSGKKDWSKLQEFAREGVNEELSKCPMLTTDNSLEQTVSRLTAEILGEPAWIGRNVCFSQAGLDSIGAVRLMHALNALENVRQLSEEDLLQDDATVETISQLLSKNGQCDVPIMGKSFLDTEVTRLVSRIHVLHGDGRNSQVPGSIVLTGATGYLGSFILAEILLRFPETKVWCIVRSGGMPRLLRSLRRTQINLPDATIKSNVGILRGDLTLDNLGLSSSDKQHVASADLIIHNAAVVHWTRPYRALVGPNIESLITLLALAPTSARLVFVSGGGQTALDDGVPEAFASANGYTATKYVAERLCEKAGPGVQIVRPGFIIGQPVCNADDFLWRLVRTSIELGIYVVSDPGVPPMSAIPVRDVARRVIHPKCSLDRLWIETSLNDIWSTLLAAGYTIEPVSENEWNNRLRADLEVRGAEHPLFTLATSAFELSKGLGYRRPAELPGEKLEPGILSACIGYLCESGAIPEPRRGSKIGNTNGYVRRARK